MKPKRITCYRPISDNLSIALDKKIWIYPRTKLIIIAAETWTYAVFIVHQGDSIKDDYE